MIEEDENDDEDHSLTSSVRERTGSDANKKEGKIKFSSVILFFNLIILISF